MMPVNGVGVGLNQSMMVGGSRGTELPPGGLTALRREMFTANRTAGSPGSFTTVSSGQIMGGLRGGPAVAGGPHVSGGMRRPTASEVSAGATLFDARFTWPNLSGLANPAGMVCGWFYLCSGVRAVGAAFQPLIKYTSYFGALPFTIDVKWDYTTSTMQLRFSKLGTPISTTTVPADQWIFIGVSYSVTDIGAGNGRYTIHPFYKTRTGAITDLNAQVTGDTFLNTSADYISLCQILPANQGGPCGRVGALSIYWCPSVAAGVNYPSDIIPPTGEPFIYDIDGAAGSDSNVNGPWQTVDALVTARRNCVLLGANPAWSPDDIVDVPSTANKQAWIAAYLAGTRRPKGDIVRIKAGTYYATQSLDLTYLHGLTLKAYDATNKPVIMLDEIISGTWTQPSVGTYPNVWQSATTGAARAGVWFDSTRKALYVCRGTDVTAGKVAVNALSNSYWSNNGDTYVNCGVNPNTLTMYRAKGVDGVTMTDGLVKNLIIEGGLEYSNTGTEVVSHIPFAAQFYAPGGIVVHDGCVARRYGKHGFICNSNVVEGLYMQVNCTTTHGPIEDDGSSHGFSYLNWTASVDYSDYGSTGTIVTYYYQCVDTLSVAVVGSASAAAPSGTPTQSYYSHNAGVGTGQFALTVLNGCSFQTVNYSTEHTAFSQI